MDNSLWLALAIAYWLLIAPALSIGFVWLAVKASQIKDKIKAKTKKNKDD